MEFKQNNLNLQSEGKRTVSYKILIGELVDQMQLQWRHNSWQVWYLWLMQNIVTSLVTLHKNHKQYIGECLDVLYCLH